MVGLAMPELERVAHLGKLLDQLGFEGNRKGKLNFVFNATMIRHRKIKDYSDQEIERAIDLAQLFLDNRQAENGFCRQWVENKPKAESKGVRIDIRS